MPIDFKASLASSDVPARSPWQDDRHRPFNTWACKQTDERNQCSSHHQQAF